LAQLIGLFTRHFRGLIAWSYGGTLVGDPSGTRRRCLRQGLRCRGLSISRSQRIKKDFFSEEKKQKTFASLSRLYPAAYTKDAKVFWFFFSKKNCFIIHSRYSCNMADEIF
jgi:hypothetical protein